MRKWPWPAVLSEVLLATLSGVWGYLMADGVSALILAAAGGAVVSAPLVWWVFRLDQQRDDEDITVLGISSSQPNLVMFDMPIRQVIDYLGRTVTHTFDRSSLADRAAFRKLHELMCSGALPVVGATEIFGVRRRIPPEQCGELTPEEQAVPQNPSTPEGIRFCLIAYADKNWQQNWDGVTQPETLKKYTDLRVRSTDVYRLWPRTNQGGD